MKLYRLTVTALAATTLSACVNLAPEHARPQAATAPEFDPEYRPDGTVVASQLSYSQWFADPRLRGLIDSALANNRDLLAATARIEQARAQFRIQDSQRLPAVGADGSVVVTRQPVTSVDAIGNQVTSSVTSDRYQVSVGVAAFELDFWGRIANLSEFRPRAVSCQRSGSARVLSVADCQHSQHLFRNSGNRTANPAGRGDCAKPA